MTDARPRRSELVSRALSASAGLVAVSALAVSAYQAKIMRDQLRMSAWPYVHLYNSNGNGAQLFIQNVGLGPALVRSIEMTFDGRPVRSWGELTRAAAAGDTSLEASRTVTSDVGPGSVLLPGVAVENFRLVGPPQLAARLHEASHHDRLVRRVCYCSLYQQCWVADSHLPEPAPVRACSVDTARAFGR